MRTRRKQLTGSVGTIRVSMCCMLPFMLQAFATKTRSSLKAKRPRGDIHTCPRLRTPISPRGEEIACSKLWNLRKARLTGICVQPTCALHLYHREAGKSRGFQRQNLRKARLTGICVHAVGMVHLYPCEAGNLRVFPLGNARFC